MNWFQQRRGTGALPDNRTLAAIEQDYTFGEIVPRADPVNWRAKRQEEWRKFPIYDQGQSGSCVAFSAVKQMHIIYFLRHGEAVDFSARDIYRRRANRPSPGMWGYNAYDIARKEGVTLEVLFPSQRKTDAQMDAVVPERHKQEVGSIFRLDGYIVLPHANIDAIASVIQKTGKGVMVFYHFRFDEWTNVPVLRHALTGRETNIARHAVVATDFFMHEGKRALLIEDSWGLSNAIQGRRIISENFHRERNTWAAYPMRFIFSEGGTRPIHQFMTDLRFGERSDDVRALQDILRFEGLFPSNTASTGFYGSITAKAVLAFQRKHRVAPETEIAALQGRIVGAKTRRKLNALYGR